MYRNLVKFARKFVHPTGYDIVRYDPDGTLPRHLLRVLDSTRSNCILDVGANVGQFAVMLRNEGYCGWIFSFEPLPSAYAELSKKALRDPQWKTFPFALGALSEKKEFFEYYTSTLSSFKATSDIGKNRFKVSSELKSVVSVQIRRLDEVWDEIFLDFPDPRVFLKMDTQGFDSEVFEGAKEKIGFIFGLQSELSIQPIYNGMETYKDSLSRYEKVGFELTGVYPVVRSKLHTLLEMDCVMVKADCK